MESLSWFWGGDYGWWVGKEEEGLVPLEHRDMSLGALWPQKGITSLAFTCLTSEHLNSGTQGQGLPSICLLSALGRERLSEVELDPRSYAACHYVAHMPPGPSSPMHSPTSSFILSYLLSQPTVIASGGSECVEYIEIYIGTRERSRSSAH